MRLWDADRQNDYVRDRDAALQRRIEDRDGAGIARDFDAAWKRLGARERQAMIYLAACGARSCLGNCSDPLLSGLVAHGFLAWPPGVRPVLTEDLVTSFLVPAAVAEALASRFDDLRGDRSREEVLAAGRADFAAHVTPLSAAGEST